MIQWQGMAWEGVLCEWYQVTDQGFLQCARDGLAASRLPPTAGMHPCPPLHPAPLSASQSRSDNWAYGFLSNLKGDFKWNGNQASAGRS